MRKIHLTGLLGKKYGKIIELEVETIAEAIRALSTNFPGFLADLKIGSYHVVLGKSVRKGLSLGEDDIAGFRLGRSDLHILPFVAGSKNSGGILKAVLGVALIGVAFMFSGGALATPLMAGGGLLGGFTYGNLAMLGAALALQGVSTLLSPEESTTEKQDSFTLSGPGNAYEQGYPVPLVYGRVITGGVLVSGGIDIEPIAVGV
ncbi:MAG: hypothetical protein ACEQSB_00350 [Undibacterium sp.]